VPERGIDHFLCHYSSERFIPVVDELLGKAQLSIPRERWWSNLAWRGNTGAASIFIMLSEFLQKQGQRLKAGDTVLCFIPESGRFTAGYMLWEVELDAIRRKRLRPISSKSCTVRRKPMMLFPMFPPSPHPMTRPLRHRSWRHC
jgi:3-oxoacyl-[acyl-carrier-protein] synthase-3